MTLSGSAGASERAHTGGDGAANPGTHPLCGASPGGGSVAPPALKDLNGEGAAQQLRPIERVAVARAQGAANVMHAARLFSEGKREEGRDALARSTELLDKASAIAGTGALQEDRRAQKDLEAAPAGAELSHQVKKAKRAALIGFGSNGSVY